MAEKKEVKTVAKRITCLRCKGIGTWVSSRTGIRAATAGDEPAVDTSRTCPQCKGKMVVVIRITEEQAEKEKIARNKAKAKVDAENKKAKAKIDAEATAEKEVIDSK